MHKAQPLISATVVNTAENDPESAERVQIQYAQSGSSSSIWVPVLKPVYSSEEATVQLQIGDEVVVGFLNGDRNRPIVLGSV
jgi:uncharacterized protein involved in type VI secretion and phage assembly